MPTSTPPGDLPDQTLYSLADIAAWLGIRKASVVAYHRDATRRRRDGTTRPGDLPAPHQHIGGHPAWTRDQLTQWRDTRPGQGTRTDLQPRRVDHQAAAFDCARRGDLLRAAEELRLLSPEDLRELLLVLTELHEAVAWQITAPQR